MKKINRSSVLMLFTLMLALVASGYAQVNTLQIPVGQKMNIEGVVLERNGETLSVRSFGNATYKVFVTDSTKIKEKKSNPFRGSKKYSQLDLVPGLQVQVKGIGTSAGVLAASEVNLKNDDHIVAQAMDTRVVPVENSLHDTQVRLGETEQNAQRLSGQIQELSAITDLVKSETKAAQETADTAVAAAAGAQSTADSARAGVRLTNERIASLDDFDVKTSATVYFKAGSAVLDKEYQASLGEFAEQIQSEKGYIIEVAGFASSDGDVAANRRLSQRRADAVIQYLAENYMIPMRRFVTPMGYGESQPVGDNNTREGRSENRRVEVNLLVSRGLTTDSVETAEAGTASRTTVQTSQVR